jgi:hypothetical protein
MLADNYSGPKGTGVTAPSGRRVTDVGQGKPGILGRPAILRKLVKGSAKQFGDSGTIEGREELISSRGKNLKV